MEPEDAVATTETSVGAALSPLPEINEGDTFFALATFVVVRTPTQIPGTVSCQTTNVSKELLGPHEFSKKRTLVLVQH